MMELWEVFDATNDDLLTELAALREQLPIVRGPDRFKYEYIRHCFHLRADASRPCRLIQLQDCISTELMERGQSDSLFNQLALTTQIAAPPPMPPTNNLQQELTAIIQEARAIAASSQPQPQPSPSSINPLSPNEKKEAKSRSKPQPAEIPAAYANYDLDPNIADQHHSSSDGDDDDDDDDDDIIDDTPVKGGSKMTPLEAALAAFRAERKQVIRARASIVHKKKPAAASAPPPVTVAARRKAPLPPFEATQPLVERVGVGSKQGPQKIPSASSSASVSTPNPIAPLHSPSEPHNKKASSSHQSTLPSRGEETFVTSDPTVIKEKSKEVNPEVLDNERTEARESSVSSPPPPPPPSVLKVMTQGTPAVVSDPPLCPPSPHTSDGGHSSSLNSSRGPSDDENEDMRTPSNRPPPPSFTPSYQTAANHNPPSSSRAALAPALAPAPSQASASLSAYDRESDNQSSDEDEDVRSRQRSNQDRSDFGPGAFVRAVVDGFGAVDRWSDWDNGDKMGVTAWSKDGDEDEVAGIMRQQQQRESRHAPPQHQPVAPSTIVDKKPLSESLRVDRVEEKEARPPSSSSSRGPLPSSLRPSSALRPPIEASSRSQGSMDKPGGLPRPPPPSQPQPSYPGSSYLSCFNAFHEILSIMHHLLVSYHNSNSSAPPPSSLFHPSDINKKPGLHLIFHPSDIIDKYKGLMIRCRAWIDELAARKDAVAAAALAKANRYKGILIPCSDESKGNVAVKSPDISISSTSDAELTRYYAVADDSAHPEVREVLRLAMEGWEGWEPDPIDQTTATSSPPRPTNLRHPSPTSSSTSSAPPSVSRPLTAPTQPRPLAGRCHLWNILWTWSVKVRVPFSDLLVWQKVNHFPEARQLTRKDLLKKHLMKCQATYAGSKISSLFNILPTTFTLPKETSQFEEAFTKAAHGVEASITQPKGMNLWILKPVALSRGRGIRIISDWAQEVNQAPPGSLPSFEEPAVVQRYLTSPLLIQGYKFDLRLYVAVASFNPLEASICTEGFARFSTVPFTLDSSKFGDTLMHLTNSSIQKQRSDDGHLPSFLKQVDVAGGSKCSLSTLSNLLASQGVEWAPLWSQIQQLVLVALFAAQDSIPHCVNSFELFGFDVMIDSSLKAWIIEVNSSPSLSLDTALDRAIKPAVIKGLLQLLDPLPFDREALLEALDQRVQGGKSRIARGRAGGGLMTGTMMEERELMCNDLQQVLKGRTLRAYGSDLVANGQEGVEGAASYQRLAPSPIYDKLLKLKKPI